MKIAIAIQNLSNNCLGRAYVIYKCLPSHQTCTLIGPCLGTSIWHPLSNAGLPIKQIPVHFKSRFFIFLSFCKMLLEFDIIYVSKPLPLNLGSALMVKLICPSKKILIDIDDWQYGFLIDLLKHMHLLGRIKYFILSLLHPWDDFSLISIRLLEYICVKIKATTTSNSFLLSKFGGSLFPHYRDNKDLDPSKFDASQIRKRLTIDSALTLIMFLGTPRKHKGLQVLIDAFKNIEYSNSAIIIIGLDDNDKVSLDLKEEISNTLPGRALLYPSQPFEKLGEFLCIADIIVIPQTASTASKGQLPAKLFDAMAMAKPIVTTTVGDIPEILGDNGWLIPPDNPDRLTLALREILQDRKKAELRGRGARQRFLDHYTFDIGRNRMRTILSYHSIN